MRSVPGDIREFASAQPNCKASRARQISIFIPAARKPSRLTMSRTRTPGTNSVRAKDFSFDPHTRVAFDVSPMKKAPHGAIQNIL
jgi:hypothetical protein